MEYLFVYGTLMKGMERHECLEASTFLGAAEASGDLYDLGEYPGLVKGDGVVVGELYQINEILLCLIDEIEEFSSTDVKNSLYRREKDRVTLRACGKTYSAYLYIYNQHVPEHAEKIFDGDFRRHVSGEKFFPE